MSPIYTKKGDSGETGMLDGSRLPKNHIRVEAVGTLDEANAVLGIILSRVDDFTQHDELDEVQRMLFEIGAVVANPARELIRPHEGDVTHLEMLIDEITNELPVQDFFILPGGTSLAATIHLARTVVRRAERRLITVSQHDDVPVITIRYLNRLSDYLYVLARLINDKSGIKDIPWRSQSGQS